MPGPVHLACQHHDWSRAGPPARGRLSGALPMACASACHWRPTGRAASESEPRLGVAFKSKELQPKHPPGRALPPPCLTPPPTRMRPRAGVGAGRGAERCHPCPAAGDGGFSSQIGTERPVSGFFFIGTPILPVALPPAAQETAMLLRKLQEKRGLVLQHSTWHAPWQCPRVNTTARLGPLGALCIKTKRAPI